MARVPGVEAAAGFTTDEYCCMMASDSDSDGVHAVSTNEYELMMAPNSDSEAVHEVPKKEIDLMMTADSDSEASTVFARGASSTSKGPGGEFTRTDPVPGVTSDEYNLLMASDSDSETDEDELHRRVTVSTPTTPGLALSGAAGSDCSPASLLSPATDMDLVPRRLFSTPSPVQRLASTVADPSRASSPSTGSTTITESDSDVMAASLRGVDSTPPAVRACRYPPDRNPFEQAAVDTDFHNTTTRRAAERKQRKPNTSSKQKKKVIDLFA